MKNKIIFFTFLFSLPFNTLLAGPGGKIAQHVFQSFWGQLLLFVIVILFFPFLVYWYIIEKYAYWKTKQDLKKLSKLDNRFEWFQLKSRVQGIFSLVHRAWSEENMQEVAPYVTHWYWQNQQLVYLDKWKKQGLVNHTDLKKINKIEPLFVKTSGLQQNLQGSRIVFAINAYMEDYLAKRDNGQIVEGKRGYFDVETIWTFVLQNQDWVLENIEQLEVATSYAKLRNELSLSLLRSQYAQEEQQKI